jgi:hypothetical protein
VSAAALSGTQSSAWLSMALSTGPSDGAASSTAPGRLRAVELTGFTERIAQGREHPSSRVLSVSLETAAQAPRCEVCPWPHRAEHHERRRTVAARAGPKPASPGRDRPCR